MRDISVMITLKKVCIGRKMSILSSEYGGRKEVLTVNAVRKVEHNRDKPPV